VKQDKLKLLELITEFPDVFGFAASQRNAKSSITTFLDSFARRLTIAPIKSEPLQSLKLNE